MDITNPLLYAAPAFVGFILLEYTTNHFWGDNKLYKTKDFKTSLFIGVGTLVLSSLIKVTLIAFLFSFVYDFFNPMVDGVRMNIMGYQSFGFEWYFWIICQFLDDLTFYWYHRLSHTIRILWAAHLPHHSSEHYNYGTGVRIGWFVIAYKPFFYLWLLAIGFPYEMLFICMGIETIYQFQLHTKYVPKLGFVERVLVTHTQHQVHHSRYIPHLDKNHGGILSIFDQLFGTYYSFEKADPIEFGVLHPPTTHNPFIILTHEFKNIWQDVKQAKSIRDKWMYIFGPPGWSADHTTKTAKELQKDFYASAPI